MTWTVSGRRGLLQRGWFLATVLAVAATLSLLQLHRLDRDIPLTESDLIPRLVGTRDALQGRDPYSAGVLRDIQTAYYGRWLSPSETADPQRFLYPALIVPLLAPLAQLPWETVRLGFNILMSAGLGFATCWWMSVLSCKVERRYRVAIPILSVAWWPAVWALRLQQPTIVVAILISAAMVAVQRRYPAAAGALLALALFKPQIAILCVLWLAMWAVLRRQWSFFTGFFVTAVILETLTERIVPGWFPTWIESLHGYSQLARPVLEMLLGRVLGEGLTGALGIGSAWLMWRMRDSDQASRRFGEAVALVLATTVCVVPTKLPMIYNQVLLVPAILVLAEARPVGDLAQLSRRVALMFVAWGFLAVPVAVVGETVWPSWAEWQALPFQNLLMPVAVTVALQCHLWPVQREGKRSPAVNPEPEAAELAG